MNYPPTKTKPWKHQQELWDISKDIKSFYIAHDMGCGKSKEAIDYANGIDAKSILIFCPKKVTGVWPKQFEIHSHVDYNVLITEKGNAIKKARLMEDHIERCRLYDNPYAVIFNYEIIIRPPLGPSYDKNNRMLDRGILLKYTWDLLIVDEAHRIKAPGGKASWNVMRMGKLAKSKRFLSGTPMPHSPLDIYAQYRALDSSVFGTRYDYFKYMYCIMGGYENKQVVEFKNLEDLNKKFFSIAHYVSSEDALDLPDKSDHILSCTLKPATMKVYNELNKEFITWVDEEEVTVTNALVKLLRLAQITGGYLVFDDKSDKIIDDSKIDSVIEFLMDLPPKENVIIFCRFVNEINRLAEKIENKFSPDRSVGFICGFLDLPIDFYDGIWHATDTNTLIVQVQAGSEGLDFTAGHYAIFMSMGFSLGQYRQCKKRVHRPGQTKKTFYYHVIAENTVDQKIMDAIKKKQDIVDYILEELNPHYIKN